jgi:hypothetical protein
MRALHKYSHSPCPPRAVVEPPGQDLEAFGAIRPVPIPAFERAYHMGNLHQTVDL